VPAGSPLSDGDKTGGSQNSVNRYLANQNNTGAKTTDAKPTAGRPSAAELPGEATAVVLSSKGADNRLMHSEQPVYPAGAAPHQAQGPMVLKAVIDANGKVVGARVIHGDAALANAAVSAVKQWRYKPYIRDGKAQPFQTVVAVDFQRP
jgi:TonB family protein